MTTLAAYHGTRRERLELELRTYKAVLASLLELKHPNGVEIPDTVLLDHMNGTPQIEATQHPQRLSTVYFIRLRQEPPR